METRNRLITAHLARLEASLARTQEAVTSLRELLDHPQRQAPIDHRRLAGHRRPRPSPTPSIEADALVWYQGALGELQAMLAAQGIAADRAAGGIFADELFTDEPGPGHHLRALRPVAAAGRVESRS